MRAYREALLEAAEQRFATHGIDDTKMEDIAREAGLSLGTLYSVLEGGKAELVATIHQTRLGELVGSAVDARDAEGPPDKRLKLLFERAVHFFLGHPSCLRMHLREGSGWGLGSVAAMHSTERLELFGAGVGAIVDLLEEGMKAGIFDIENPERTGRAVVMVEQVHLFDWLERGEIDGPEIVFPRIWNDVERLLGIAGR